MKRGVGADAIVPTATSLSQTVKPASAPTSANRVLDVTALLMVVGGIVLFAFARSALTGIGNGSRTAPAGMSAITMADFHVAQSKMGLFIVVLGVLLGVIATVRHKLQRIGQ